MTREQKIAEAREMLWCAQRARVSQPTVLQLKKALRDAEAGL
jgi:hypothetical protein